MVMSLFLCVFWFRVQIQNKLYSISFKYEYALKKIYKYYVNLHNTHDITHIHNRTQM